MGRGPVNVAVRPLTELPSPGISMRYWLLLMFVALTAAVVLWAAQRYVYPDTDDQVAAFAVRVSHLEAQIESLPNAGQDVAESEANQLLETLGRLQEEIGRIEQRQRVRSWLSNGQLLFVIIAVACQLAFLRQHLRSDFKDGRTTR